MVKKTGTIYSVYHKDTINLETFVRSKYSVELKKMKAAYMIIRLSNRVCSMVYYDMKVMIIFKLYNRWFVTKW